MKGFFKTCTRHEIVEIAAGFQAVGKETVVSAKASGRVLSADVVSPCDVPHFSRSTMDGYAVIADGVSEASVDHPVTLRVVGRVEMGHAAQCAVGQGTAVEVGTGAALPDGADAVVMIEYTEHLPDNSIAVTRPVARYENIMRVGDDFRKGSTILRAGKRLAPKDVAALTSVGAVQLEVFKKPVATVVSTGDELVPHEEEPGVGQIRETNSAVLAALLERDGGVAVRAGIVRDELDVLNQAIGRGIESSDMVLISGGSSVGARDFTFGGA
jgi:molybdopterin molybdotransferase